MPRVQELRREEPGRAAIFSYGKERLVGQSISAIRSSFAIATAHLRACGATVGILRVRVARLVIERAVAVGSQFAALAPDA